MQSNFYIPKYQYLIKEVAMDILEIKIIGVGLFAGCSQIK